MGVMSEDALSMRKISQSSLREVSARERRQALVICQALKTGMMMEIWGILSPVKWLGWQTVEMEDYELEWLLRKLSRDARPLTLQEWI